MSSENKELEYELKAAIARLLDSIRRCTIMGTEVHAGMSDLSDIVEVADLSTREVFRALSELSLQYFTFKTISTASKNVTQYNDEYFMRFSFYNDLRRISLGYVIALDTNIISSENARKKVEKAYLQNTEYWLAYCISAVMLWASNEKEAANRALSKSLSINYFSSCLFYLLINLRFNRAETAKKWYVNFLEYSDVNNLGEEWQYLLQAYLCGAFGSDEEFQDRISKRFQDMLVQVEVTTVDFSKKISKRALEFAQTFIYKTDQEYALLRRNCVEYESMKNLLSTAQKNLQIAKYYDDLAQEETSKGLELPQRIENVLYSLISDYDKDELEVVQKIKYNEAIIMAKGDIAAARAKYNAIFEERNKKKNLGDLMLGWAFASDTDQSDISVKRFAISFMKESIKKGLEQFVEAYKVEEKSKYTLDIDECKLECDENDYVVAEKKLNDYYDKNKFSNMLKDKQIKIYGGLCILTIVMLLSLVKFFSPVILTFAILTGLIGSFLLWRRIVDVNQILKERKRKGKLLLKQTLQELANWREAYREADAGSITMLSAIERF